MKRLPAAFRAHLDSGATTLCHCWRIERRDGAIFGFTDHDRPLGFAGTTYLPESGFTASEAVSSLGLAVDGLEIEGALSSDAIRAEDLTLGLWDGATIDIYRVNWADATQRVLMRSGTLGEVSRGGLAFHAEIRSLAEALNHASGRTYARVCDAVLGDARCAVDLSRPAFRGAGIVAAAVDDRFLVVNGLHDFAAGWFVGGLLSFIHGANRGTEHPVVAHRLDPGGGVRLTLSEGAALPIAVGDRFTITAGCDKTFATCRSKFANGANFRGFPHMPGNDAALGVAKRSLENDGGSFFKD